MAGPRPHAGRLRSRRWLAWAVVVVALLGVYAIGLRWVTLRVESGVEASLHPLAADSQLQLPGH